MKFCHFIEKLKSKMNCSTQRQLFLELGGEKGLKIKERRWLQIATGAYPPPMHLLASLFEKIDPQDKKDYVASFLDSALEESPGKKSLIDYLAFEIRPPRQRAESNPWDRPYQFYSDEQLSLLSDDSKAFHLYKRVLLLDDEPLKVNELKKDAETVKKLVKQGLLETKNGILQTIKKRFRLPRYETHGARSVALTNKYISRHFDQYVSWEGGPKQSLEFVSLTVDPSRVETIQREATEFRHWIHSQALEDPKAPQVPMVCVLFVKELKRSEV